MARWFGEVRARRGGTGDAYVLVGGTRPAPAASLDADEADARPTAGELFPRRAGLREDATENALLKEPAGAL
jgi:hypothetical protein